MNPFCLDINTITHSVRLLLGFLVLGENDRQLAFEDEVSGETSVSVWGIMGIAMADCQPRVLRGHSFSRVQDSCKADLRAI